MAQPLLAPPSVYMAERVAPKAYLHLLALMITGLPLNCPLGGAFSTKGSAKFRRCANSMLIGQGYSGGGPPHSIAMAGFARLASVAAMISQIKLKGLKGGYLEAGVWKGGVTVLAAAALQVPCMLLGNGPCTCATPLRACQPRATAARALMRATTAEARTRRS